MNEYKKLSKEEKARIDELAKKYIRKQLEEVEGEETEEAKINHFGKMQFACTYLSSENLLKLTKYLYFLAVLQIIVVTLVATGIIS